MPFTSQKVLVEMVARAGIEPATFRFSDGLVLGWNLFALVKLDKRPAYRRVRSVGPARWPHLGPADSSERRNIEAMWRLRWELGGRLDVV